MLHLVVMFSESSLGYERVFFFFPLFFLSFITLILLRSTGQLFCRNRPLIWVFLVFSHDSVEVMLFWQEYCASAVPPSQGILSLMLICLITWGINLGLPGFFTAKLPFSCLYLISIS